MHRILCGRRPGACGRIPTGLAKNLRMETCGRQDAHSRMDYRVNRCSARESVADSRCPRHFQYPMTNGDLKQPFFMYLLLLVKKL